MKAAFYFAIRELRRKPGHFIARTIVSAAILMTLILNVMQMNAAWREDVMPERPENYHFTVKGLTQLEKTFIRSKPWVQVCYDVERTVKRYVTADDTLNVRVIWSENNSAMKHALELFDELDLWDREVYKSDYDSYVNENLRNLKASYKTKDENYPVSRTETLRHRAQQMAKSSLIQSKSVKNRSYCNSVTNSYTMRPEFFVLSNLLALFLGGVMMILQSESYRALMPEFGALRSFGLRREQIFYINGYLSLASSIASIPLGAVISWASVRVYLLLNSDVLADDSIFLKLTEDVPVSVILAMSLLLAVVALAGTMLVCYHYRNRSTMELLKREGSVQVSYVAKTSPRFEKAKSASIYSSLQIRRTRMSFVLTVAIIAIMLPLPLYLVMSAAQTLFIGDSLSRAELAKGMYYIYQAIVMFVTSVTVIYVAARSKNDERHGEFAILRSLGMNKEMIRRTAFPAALWQIAMTVIPTVALFGFITDQSTYASTSAVGRFRHLTLVEFLKTFGMESLGVILLIAPPMLLAMAFSLLRFNKRSVIESIRETE